MPKSLIILVSYENIQLLTSQSTFKDIFYLTEVASPDHKTHTGKLALDYPGSGQVSQYCQHDTNHRIKWVFDLFAGLPQIGQSAIRGAMNGVGLITEKQKAATFCFNCHNL